jgi:hypothetical protein
MGSYPPAPSGYPFPPPPEKKPVGGIAPEEKPDDENDPLPDNGEDDKS